MNQLVWRVLGKVMADAFLRIREVAIDIKAFNIIVPLKFLYLIDVSYLINENKSISDDSETDIVCYDVL